MKQTLTDRAMHFHFFPLRSIVHSTKSFFFCFSYALQRIKLTNVNATYAYWKCNKTNLISRHLKFNEQSENERKSSTASIQWVLSSSIAFSELKTKNNENPQKTDLILIRILFMDSNISFSLRKKKQNWNWSNSPTTQTRLQWMIKMVIKNKGHSSLKRKLRNRFAHIAKTRQDIRHFHSFLIATLFASLCRRSIEIGNHTSTQSKRMKIIDTFLMKESTNTAMIVESNVFA